MSTITSADFAGSITTSAEVVASLTEDPAIGSANSGAAGRVRSKVGGPDECSQWFGGLPTNVRLVDILCAFEGITTCRRNAILERWDNKQEEDFVKNGKLVKLGYLSRSAVHDRKVNWQGDPHHHDRANWKS
jgi:hypothetical protein